MKLLYFRTNNLSCIIVNLFIIFVQLARFSLTCQKVISAAVKVVYYRNHEYCQIYYKNEAINNYHQVTNNHLPTLIPSPFHMPITIWFEAKTWLVYWYRKFYLTSTIGQRHIYFPIKMSSNLFYIVFMYCFDTNQWTTT